VSITYYTQTADKDHWSSVWEQQQLNRLLAIAARDPLSCYLEAYLPTSGVILEGGYGLGQYVLFFRQRGYDIIGSDFSHSIPIAPPRACESFPCCATCIAEQHHALQKERPQRLAATRPERRRCMVCDVCYTGPRCSTFAYMILAVAQKPES
jgi:hypothetical protein